MTNWRLRGLVFAAAMVVVRLFQGALINAFPTRAALISIVLVLLFAVAVIAWGLIDGRADAAAQPDPDRRQDLAMTWLLAGLVAGILGGAVAWLISLVYTGLYTGGLINEVSTFAAFTALLVFLPGMGGVTLGRWLIDRHAPPPPKHGHREEDTDVFAAVHEDEAPTDGMAAVRAGEQPTQPTSTSPDTEQTERAPGAGEDQR